LAFNGPGHAVSSPLAISVVIPTFNRAGVLARCLASVLGQTLSPLEIVVVDDGSTDETADVVKAQASERIRYVRLPQRSGAQAARNRGIRESKGNWIAFQDSDDEWLPDKLERQIALLAEADFDRWTVVHGQALVQEPSGSISQMGAPSIPEQRPLDVLLRGPATFFPALLVSRPALARLGSLDESVPSFQEWETSIRLAKFCRFVEPRQPVFLYHRMTHNAISRSGPDDIRGYEYVIEKFRDEIVERCGEDAWDDHILGQLQRSLEFELWDDARRFLALMRERDARYYMYALCLRLRVRPSYIDRVRRFFGRSGSRRRTAAAA
jgi:glycosyltransferase involved in cell wall biosynthesis